MSVFFRHLPRLQRVPSCKWQRPLKCIQQASQQRSLASATGLQFGQPLHETHPHLLKPGELTPGITALEYAERRLKLADSLPPNSVAVFAAADLKYRSGPVFYPFHQDPDFLYLTGFNEPEAVAIIEKPGPDAYHRFHLYVRPKDPKVERWDGFRSGIQAAQDVFNADEVGDIYNAHVIFPDIISGAQEVYTDLPGNANDSSAFSNFFFGASSTREKGFAQLLRSSKVRPSRMLMNNLRVQKSEAEVRNLRKAGQASGRAFTDSMRKYWHSEKELETFIEHVFKIRGCDTSAYVPVVAGGLNASTIHYVHNDAMLRNGEMVTVDAGGEYGGYITDITRSWPVDGKFTQAQRDLYEVILRVQRSCISLCRANAGHSLDQLHVIADEGLQDGLKQLGFDLSGNAMEMLFPHHVGHHIGLCVHDSPGYPRTTALSSGHCITIEPGIYVDEDERWPEHFRGIGIRIEDSVCVQAEHPYVLTTEAVKEIVDIEALRR